MSDYISREAAIADFEQCNRENPVWTPQRVKTLLMRIPAADVEPVRHGRWIVPPPPDAYTYCKVVCSECHKVAGKHKTVYCPNCGAKMELEDENGT